MSEQKYGIEKVSKAIILGIETGNVIANGLKDGFDPLQDTLQFLVKGTEIQQMIKQDGEAIKNEFLDIDKEEGQKLNALVAEKFNISNHKAERMAEAGFNILMGVIYFADQINEPEDEATAGK